MWLLGLHDGQPSRQTARRSCRSQEAWRTPPDLGDGGALSGPYRLFDPGVGRGFVGDAGNSLWFQAGDRSRLHRRRRIGSERGQQLPLSADDRRRAGAGDRLPLLLRILARRAGGGGPAPPRARQPAHSGAALLRGEPAVGDRVATHLRHRDRRAGGGIDRLDRAAQRLHRRRGHHLSVRLVAQAGRIAPARHSGDHRADPVARRAGPQFLA